VIAPFDGTIARRLVNPGDLATPGTPLLELYGAAGLRVEIEVPASFPTPLLGTPIAGDIASSPFTGALAEISGTADPLTRTRLAKVTLPPAAAARSGDYVRVAWPAGTTTALLVPAAAISLFGQMERVFVVNDGRARLRLVKTSGPAVDPALVLIAAGLDAGETVILAPTASLRDGQPVTIVP
jgi:RND family efflux transporter MFP subunit